MRAEFETDHNNTVKVIKESLENEFGVKVFADVGDKIPSHHFNGKRPDVFLIKHSKNILVVEVGQTTAEKITEYFKNEKIDEIRWYTRKGIMAGLWKRDHVEWVNSHNSEIELWNSEKG